MRRLYDMEVCEYFYEWYSHGTAVAHHKAWVDERRYIASMRIAMKRGNFYRLTLNTDEEIVVAETHTITVERY